MERIKSPVLESILRVVRPLFGKKARPRPKDQTQFRFRYVNFQELLESNSELLKIISTLEEKLSGGSPFGMPFLRSVTSQAVFHSLRMVRGYENLSGHAMPVLRQCIEGLAERFKEILSARAVEQDVPWFLDFSQISRNDADHVGGKCANLGETRNRAMLPVPDGFAITTSAFNAFLEKSGLRDEIAKLAMTLDPQDPGSIQQASEDIQRMMLLAPLPESFAEELLERHAALAGNMGRDPGAIRVALRSSAIGEDGELSFAGQYLSVLGVTREKLVESYRYVAASLYTPRAIAYRMLKGVPDEAAAMAVACIAMVESRASGVLYTRHPFDPKDRDILVNAVWGLGPYAVDGVVDPSRYVLRASDLEILSRHVARQTVRLELSPAGGVARADVEQENVGAPCLTDEQVRALGAFGRQLEEHFGRPQDVEWALDAQGRLLVLQTRPLTGAWDEKQLGHGAGDKRAPIVDGAELVLDGGDTACPGAGCGPVCLVRNDDDLAAFPEGAVLVAAHSSPKFMVAMNRAAAIVTDHGSVTGHMASLTREFGVPTLLGVHGATTRLAPGAVVTVDATNARVYAGRVEPVLAGAVRHQAAPMLDTPVHRMLRDIFALIAPLNLLDPKSPRFAPACCTTLHDITRFLHEMSYTAMFKLGDMAAGQGGMAVRLDAGVGLDLHVIDLGGGLVEEPGDADRVRVDEVLSRPLRALMRGLADEAFVAKGPRPVQLRGFLSVMSRQMVDGGNSGAERFGDKSYAIVSDKYLNFSSRVGYHYGVLDCYCGNTLNKNYITFAFKGGAAGEERRARRARAIALILERLDFSVSVNGDRVEGRFQKYPAELIEDRLEQLGRLLQFTRQTDMLMTSDQAVTAMAECFLRGDCVFGIAGEE